MRAVQFINESDELQILEEYDYCLDLNLLIICTSHMFDVLGDVDADLKVTVLGPFT